MSEKYESIKKPIFIRDAEGNVKRFNSTEECAQYCNTTKQSVYQAVSKGYLLARRWQVTHDKDWSKCNDFVAKSFNPRQDASIGKERVAKRVRDLSAERKKIQDKYIAPIEIKEPKTEADFEAMRQRAMQPFVCSLSDEDLKRHEEETRRESIENMKKMYSETKKRNVPQSYALTVGFWSGK